MNDIENILVRNLTNNTKKTSFKPKHSVLFEVKDVKIEGRITKSKATTYVHVPCTIISIDGKDIFRVNSEVQMSEVRDFMSYVCFLKYNNLLNQESTRVRMNRIDLKVTTFELVHQSTQ